MEMPAESVILCVLTTLYFTYRIFGRVYHHIMHENLVIQPIIVIKNYTQKFISKRMHSILTSTISLFILVYKALKLLRKHMPHVFVGPTQAD